MFWLLHIVTPLAHADVDLFIKKLNTYLVNPAIYFFVVLAVAIFIYGIFEYIRDAGSSDGREKGQQHMFWGIIGLSIMVSVFLIMRIILGSLGLTEEEVNVETGAVNIDLSQ